MKSSPDPHYRHRFPAEVISHAVWLYHVFSLSLRDVELLLAERGVTVSYETVRRWCRKFGESFAYAMRRRRPRTGDKWHMDEVFIRIQGVQHHLWRAVDQDGVVLDILVPEGLDTTAAKRFFKKLLKGLLYVPRVIIIDKTTAWRAVTCFPRWSTGRAGTSTTAPRIHTGRRDDENGRCSGSNHPVRRKASFPHTRSSMVNFHPRRHPMGATAYRAIRSEAFDIWRQDTCVSYAA